MKRAVVALATAFLIVTAGCAATPGTGTSTVADSDGDDGAAGDGTDGDAGGTDGGTDTADSDSGTVNFYVSDEPNDMDDFQRLNVTISSVQFHLVDAADNESADEGNASTATAAVTPENGTDAGDANETATAVETDENETDENETETDADERDDDREDDESEGEDGRWVTRDVNATEVDLSQLRGANATLLQQFDLPAGEYDKVHMEVSEVNGTLTNGDSANVKLPSEKLQLNSEFTVENGSEVDFVYDVTVHEAGKSGKYILKPVVSESGTDVPIERVDDEGNNDDREEKGESGDRDDKEKNGDEGRDDAERTIDASFLGNVSAGENVTVRVTENGSAVANATVTVDGEVVGTTDADGEYVVSVPSDAEKLEIGVQSGDAEAELEAEFEASERDGERDGTNADGGSGNGNGSGAASLSGADAVSTAP
ncbi:DUF4382 domain-containing protein [Halosimplex aquaticum]|uniref:DUF4382 domain-containing protein n=1 Tax=Halosimplex aquaticum TaxID=3026162 RepID=A0ABD5Y697_9EURY|nr:DUF4382 domain-containing protein [Halosimplex aquaticum]